MFSPLRLTQAVLVLSLGSAFSLYAATHSVPLGQIADQQTRHIATYFPGRMAGSPAELMAADYLHQRFNEMGYQSNLRAFNTRFLYTSKDGKQDWHNVSATSVIAARNGSAPQQIIVVAHFDTYTPQSDTDVDHNLGGLTLQGVDDNASGVGVMLELAERMSRIPTRYSLRFVAMSAEEIGNKGSEDYVQRMSEEEKKNTLLVINLDSLVTGDKLYFNSGLHTPSQVTKKTRDRALDIARRYGIPAATNPGSNPSYPQGTGCCSDLVAFDNAHIPVLSIEATNWTLGKKDGYQQRKISPRFPQGSSWHQSQIDNMNYLDRALPGRIVKRSRDVVKVVLPLIEELGVNGA